MTPIVSPDALNEDARLIILKELAAQHNGSLHSGLLHRVLANFGHRGTRDWVHTQLYKLEEVGGVRLTQAGSVIAATITRAGLAHISRDTVLGGVARPNNAVD